MTIETLSNIKTPSVVFAKQANISQGHQQVNNNLPAQASHAGKNKKPPNKILTELPNETLDTGRTGVAIPVNSDLEALGEKHGAKIGSG